MVSQSFNFIIKFMKIVNFEDEGKAKIVFFNNFYEVKNQLMPDKKISKVYNNREILFS